MWVLLRFFRVSEGVEYYLDLLAALHSEDQHGVRLKTLTDTQDNLTMSVGHICVHAVSSFLKSCDVFIPELTSVCCLSPSQVHAEISPLPRLPELYLEAGAALLMARRPADCMALCDEVISTTLELLPERVVLEEPEETCEAEARAQCAEGEDSVGVLLWAGAAYLLQGHCHTHLKDWKQAVTHYTRSVR